MKRELDDSLPLVGINDGIRAASASLARRNRRVLSRDRSAAVLLPLVDDGGPLRLLLTKRTEGLPTHKGQVAFPGGGSLPADGGPIGAALREAEEEIGLSRQLVEVIGLLDDFPTIAGDLAVTPVVGRITDVSGLRAAPHEVARIFFIPLSELTDPSRWVTRSFESNGNEWPVYYFEHDGETLWGLSAYITLHFLEASQLGAPVPLPAARIT